VPSLGETSCSLFVVMIRASLSLSLLLWKWSVVVCYAGSMVFWAGLCFENFVICTPNFHSLHPCFEFRVIVILIVELCNE